MIAQTSGFGLFFNAASLSGKLHDLHDYIYNRPQLSIIGIVETWLHKDIPNDCLNEPDYNVFRFDRATRGGGLMLLIHKNFTIIKSACLSFGSIQAIYCDVECMFYDFTSTRIICVYRPPNCELAYSFSFFSTLESVIAPFKTNLPIFLMEDLNLTKIDWTSQLSTLNHSTADSEFILSCQRTQLTQHVSYPTRHNNFTDLFSSQNDLVTNVLVNAPFSTSDHNTISFKFLSSPISVPRMVDSVSPHIPTKLDFSKTNSAGLSTSLLAIDWRQQFSLTDNIDMAWNNFINLFHALVLKFTPLKQASNSYHASLLPHNILRLIKYKHSAWRHYSKHKCAENRKIFYLLTKIVRSSINAFRKAQEENILVSGSIKKFFNYARSRMHPSYRIGPIKRPEGTTTINDTEGLNYFITFFIVFLSLMTAFLPPCTLAPIKICLLLYFR